MIQLLTVESTEELDNQLMLKGVARGQGIWNVFDNVICVRHRPFGSYLSKLPLREPQDSYSNFNYKTDVCVNKKADNYNVHLS